MSISNWILFGSGLTPCYGIISLKKGMQFASLYIHSTFSTVLSWFLPCSSQPAIKLPSAFLKAFSMPLNNSSVFLSNKSPTGAVQNGSLMYQDLLNGHEKGVRYDDKSSCFKL